MRHPLFSRLTAVALSLSLLTLPVAQALTPSQAKTLLDEFYVDEIPEAVFEQDTIDEMLTVLGDPYTEYFTAEDYADFIASMSDSSLVGIGIVYQSVQDGLLLTQIIPGTPAERGGLQAGDLITAVDGNSVLDQDSQVVAGWIQGEEGSTVQITYLRGGVSYTAQFQRAQVVIPATTGELIDNHIGYISCSTFGDETVGHFEDLINEMKPQATVWIVDLRSNTGGITDAAAHAAGLFTGKGEMVCFRDGQDRYSSIYHTENAITVCPVIVLVDEYTASASEIFAYAIRAHGAGIVIGTRTFGKGVAQAVLDRDSYPAYFLDGDAMKITSYRFFSPSGNTTDQIGVIPDLLVDDKYTEDVSMLLAGRNPVGNNTDILRVDLGSDFPWQWYVDLKAASSNQSREALRSLLNAIPSGKNTYLGTGNKWEFTYPEHVAKHCELSYNTSTFNDHLQSNYYTALSILKTYRLVNGTDDGGFHPKDTLTRAELCQLLYNALNCGAPRNTSPYSDVSNNAWYAPAVTALSNLGLVNGTGGGRFSPEEPIDNQQFITIMGRLALRLNRQLYNTAQAAPSDFNRIVGVFHYADWAQSSVWLLSYGQKDIMGRSVNFLWTDPGDIEPTEAALRDEAAYTLYTLLSYTGILPA